MEGSDTVVEVISEDVLAGVGDVFRVDVCGVGSLIIIMMKIGMESRRWNLGRELLPVAMNFQVGRCAQARRG